MKKFFSAVATVVMWFGVAAAVVWFGTANAEISNKKAAEIAVASAVEILHGNGSERSCTGFRVGVNQYMTAKHCINTRSIKLRKGLFRQDVLQILVPMGWEKENGRQNDWLLMMTGHDLKDVPVLRAGCDEDVYLGMEVAYAGWPGMSGMFFDTGMVTSTEPFKHEGANGDFSTDLNSAGGASGSAIISMDTGKVIGILVEGYMTRAGSYAVGIQSIKYTPLCPTVKTQSKKDLEVLPDGF